VSAKFNPAKMSEEQRQARYPGIRPRSAQPQRPAVPYQRPGVDMPVAPIDPRKVQQRMEQWAARRQKTPPVAEKRLTPQNHQRPPDDAGWLADRVQEGLQAAAERGAAARRRN